MASKEVDLVACCDDVCVVALLRECEAARGNVGAMNALVQSKQHRRRRAIAAMDSRGVIVAWQC